MPLNKNLRLKLVILFLCFFLPATWLILNNFKDNIVFFYSPSDIKMQKISHSKIIRIGGLVKPSSLKRKNLDLEFIVTDLSNDIAVKYHGVAPTLFREGQGAVVKGKLSKTGFNADEILAKHDENYMPKEVADSIKKQGQWKP
jgi:cytochrome c-type biogenesis protein CcmE